MPNLYNANIRLAGHVTHDVRKSNLTRSEVIVLRAIHGDHAVVNIEVAANPDADLAKLNSDQDLARLANIYGREVVERIFRVNLDLLNLSADLGAAEQEPKQDINAILDAIDSGAQESAPATVEQTVEQTGEKADNTQQEQTTLE